jgi:hypothetical protein
MAQQLRAARRGGSQDEWRQIHKASLGTNHQSVERENQGRVPNFDF